MKKIICLCLIGVLLVSCGGCVKPKGEFLNSIALFVGSHVAYINGEESYIDKDNYFVTPFVDENNRTLVPLRYLSEALSGSTVWNNQKAVAEITFNGDQTDCEKIVVTVGSSVMIVDEKEMQLDTAAVNENGRVFVPLRAIAEAVGKEVFFDNGLILLNEHELIYEAERDRDLLNTLVNDYFISKKITELPGSMEPKGPKPEPATFYSHVDYPAVYHTFCQKHLLPVMQQKTGMVHAMDIKSMNTQGYQAEEGLVCAFMKDMDNDGVEELMTIQEVADEDIFGNESTQNTSLLVKIYRVTTMQITCLDSVTIHKLLPLFSFVDVTLKDTTLMISGIGAWAGDPGYNDHHMIRFADNHLTVESISSMDIHTAGAYDSMTEEDKSAVDAALLKLQESGLSYKEADDLAGGCDLSATRLAHYALFGKDGRFASYFKNTFELQKGFFDYTNAGGTILTQK